MSDWDFDVIVIGAGMAGASAAALLAQNLQVLLLERELHPGYHATGRSAAVFSEIYGSPAVRALSRASRAFLQAPPTSFEVPSLLTRRGALFIARADQLDALDSFGALPDVATATERMDRAEACRRSPLLRQSYVAQAIFEPDAADIDVHALLQGHLRNFRALGGRLSSDSEVNGLSFSSGRWEVATTVGRFRAPIVVNAAGAWADEIAGLAGLKPCGLQPCRRTALTVEVPAAIEVADWPMTVDIDEQFYFKPDAGRLLISPADETPIAASDVQPEELDLAIAIDRFQRATQMEVRRIQAKWAGLRTFAADRTPVVGFDGEASGFFWLAGQGGYGIQTSPAMARLTQALVCGESCPPGMLEAGLDVWDLSPQRSALKRILDH